MSGGKVSLLEKIGVQYHDFGVLLLMDADGDRITAIKKELMGNVSDINREILHQWLKGNGKQPVTWTTLVAVLQDIGLEKLAKDIEAVKMS